MLISIYTDGSSSGRILGPGGWGYVVAIGDLVVGSHFGGAELATNNQMELMAAIKGLEAGQGVARNSDLIELVSDSQLVLGLASGRFSPTKNLELVEQLRKLFLSTKPSLRWVRGHNGDPMNEMADELAKRGKAFFMERK